MVEITEEMKEELITGIFNSLLLWATWCAFAYYFFPEAPAHWRLPNYFVLNFSYLGIRYAIKEIVVYCARAIITEV